MSVSCEDSSKLTVEENERKLIRKRGICKQKLTHFKKYLETLESSLSAVKICELNLRLSKIEELYTEFDLIQSEIEIISQIPEHQFTEREEFELTYFETLAIARELSGRHAEANATSNTTGSETGTVLAAPTGLKLPTIKLPTFSGQYQDWLEFHDTFTSLIHNNNTIPNINKFHYLRAALKDTAALVIRSLEFSSENYEVAWDLLCDRFNNDRVLVNSHITNLFNMQPIYKESAQALRGIIDSTNRNLRALNTLKLPTDQWDILIIHFVAAKLDPSTNREWEEERNKMKALPTLKDFYEFLKSRADMLEAMGETNLKPKQHKTFITSLQQSNANTSTSRFACPVCKNKHSIYKCFKFKSFSTPMRIQKAKQLDLCINCLRSGHKERDCKLGPCRICSQRHNSLLHGQQPSSTLDSAASTSSSVVLAAAAPQPAAPAPSLAPPASVSSHSDITLSNTGGKVVLLSTALLKVKDKYGKEHHVRALLDNGSTASFITESLCTKLQLPFYSTAASVEGLNYQSSRITKRCEINIASRMYPYNANVSCFIVPHITQNLPTMIIDVSSFQIPSELNLADPMFHIPEKIEMLLGADIFWNVLLNNNISLGKHKPTLSDTKLGWLVSGSVPSYQGIPKHFTVHCHHLCENQLHFEMSKFFESETINRPESLTPEQKQCEQDFVANTRRDSEGSIGSLLSHKVLTKAC
ncbi:uncharacterized protein LOC121733319 [Aricia agestis]|uniref:uncharacterized protein LOC121733319 n=1 Tax=Aricia agestis TaxID=91739 RepID=UPI001C203F3D|nr:uncharacterized protein LOC121733319 [Aricia agestis]